MMYLVCFLVGGFFGVLVTSLCVMAGRCDEDEEKAKNKKQG